MTSPSLASPSMAFPGARRGATVERSRLVFSVCLFASPLSALRSVLRDQSSELLPLLPSLLGLWHGIYSGWEHGWVGGLGGGFEVGLVMGWLSLIWIWVVGLGLASLGSKIISLMLFQSPGLGLTKIPCASLRNIQRFGSRGHS